MTGPHPQAGFERASAAAAAVTLRDFEQSLPMQLLRAREAAMARFRPMLREHGLTEQQWRVLRVLAAWPDSDASQIALRSLLLAPSLSRILQHFVGAGLVARRTPPGDQRRALFTLTAHGRALFARVAPDSERLYRDIAAAFGAARLELLYALLAEFVGALEDG
ncbi:MAG: homoprotocatechuate degradation operon regulator HpaR [Gammaproteobacteria bacterium]